MLERLFNCFFGGGGGFQIKMSEFGSKLCSFAAVSVNLALLSDVYILQNYWECCILSDQLVIFIKNYLETKKVKRSQFDEQ